jgi:acyl carrier protein
MGKINHEEFVRSIKQAFEDPPESLGLSTILRELEGWDSLTSVMLVAEIYADYRVQISGDEMGGCRTVADVMSLVEAKLALIPNEGAA